MDKILAKHSFNFNTHNNGGESLILKTTFFHNGDKITDKTGIYINQTLTLRSYSNSASFDLCGANLTPENLRELANQLEIEQNKILANVVS
jgi:hypothetical protein